MERRKFVIGLGALATGASAAVGTGALTAARLDDRDVSVQVADDSNGLITLIDGDTAATFESNGQLAIDFDQISNNSQGVNPNSTYQVGYIDDDGEDSIDEWVAGDNEIDGPDVTSQDVLYNDDVDEHNTAFTMRNETTDPLNIEIFYEGDDPGEFGTAVLVGSGAQRGAAAFAVDASNLEAGRLGGFPLDSGDSFHVSLLIKTADMSADGKDDWDGSLTVRASDVDINYVEN